MKFPISWGAKNPKIRGPLIPKTASEKLNNVIGSYTNHLSIYRGIAIAKGILKPNTPLDLSLTEPSDLIGPFPQWFTRKIVTFDPFGANISTDFSELIKSGVNLRPTIAITRSKLYITEIDNEVTKKNIFPDGKVLLENRKINVIKIAIEPVWYLPGLAQRFAVSEYTLREALYNASGGMYEELITNQEKKVFLPPIGNYSVYILGDIKKLGSAVPTALRVHDECIGSDVFGAEICTCRPYLMYGIMESIKCAQEGGLGIIIYGRKEGRSLGEVIKFMVYNARMRQEKGDLESEYFLRTKKVAGVVDIRFQELMPDILHWLGITQIDKFVSMSDSKRDAIVNSGIDVLQQISLPSERVPESANVEINAKKAIMSNIFETC